LTRNEEDHLNVLFVTESFPPKSYGGGEISCALMAQALSEKENIDVTVLTSEVEGEAKVEDKEGVKIIRRLKTGSDRSSIIENIKRKLFFKRSVRKELGDISERYDLIHFFNITSITKISKPSFATINSYLNFCPKGNLYYKEKRVCDGCNFWKFVGCIKDSEYVGNQKLGKHWTYNPFFWFMLYLDYIKRKRSLKYVDHFFSLSDFITDKLVNSGVDRKKIRKVVNMPDIEKMEKNGQKDITLAPDEDLPLLVYVGSLSKIKGVDLLIKAFNRVDEEARLKIVGDGPERKKLEKMADSSVEFLGHIDHEMTSHIYERSDIVIVPSVWPEPLSRVLLEAAYFGKPIVATDVGGSSEVVKDGYNGLLVEADQERLRDELEYIIKEKEKRKEMSKNMEEFYKEKLSREKVVKDIIDYYRAIDS